MQNSLQRVWQAKHPACPNIKACPPLSTMMVNLPCLWGSVSQLPSSHLFIHRVPAKLLFGVYAPWNKSLPATALVCTWIITDLPLASDGAEHVSGRFTSLILRRSVSLRSNSPRYVFGSFQNPARFPNGLPETRLDSGWSTTIIGFYWMGNSFRSESRYRFSRFRTYNILQHPFGIELGPFLQNREYDSEQLAGNHNQ